MSVNTTNAYGNIYITDDAIASVTEHTALECYGVVDLANKKYTQNAPFKKNVAKGVKILTLDNKIYIDIFVILKYGVSINAVSESLKRTVKYKVEKFTGMIVDSVNVNIIGVKE